jgi:hypothetical protein
MNRASRNLFRVDIITDRSDVLMLRLRCNKNAKIPSNFPVVSVPFDAIVTFFASIDLFNTN